MSNVTFISRMSRPGIESRYSRAKRGLWTTADCRRFLTELKLRPATQRAFLRRLLQRAMANGVQTDFPVTSLAVRDPVVHS